MNICTNTVRWLDPNPIPGRNVYRARLRRSNGRESLSGKTETYFLSPELPFLVFPNPLPANAALSIYRQTMLMQAPIFRLFDLEGREVLRQEVQADPETIPMNQITEGLYLYRIESGGESMWGKLVRR